jgi:hypothetical protein
MTNADPFVCFPLGLLAYSPENPETTLSMIVDYSVAAVARTTFGGWTLDNLKRTARARRLFPDKRFAVKSCSQFQLLLAADTLAVTYEGCMEHTLRAESFLAGLSSSARNNTIRVKNSWLWSCKDTIAGTSTEKTISWREFCILCALLSKVGAKGIKKCGWQEIRARAAGYCGKRDMKVSSAAELARRNCLLFSRAQIRGTLQRLETDRFFARYNYGRHGGPARESWFSFSMPREQLKTLVEANKRRRNETTAQLRQQDQRRGTEESPANRQPIANSNRKARDSADSAANVNSESLSPPIDRQPSGQHIANVGANINENNLNKNNLKEYTPATPALQLSDFLEEEILCWREFSQIKGFEGFPIEHCASIYPEFREWLTQRKQ